MKKKILIVIGIIILVSWSEQQPKTYKVEADMQTWQAILRVIDLSEAPAKDRVAVKDFIVNQLTDTTINKK